MQRIGWAIAILLLAASCAPVRTTSLRLPPPFRSTPDQEKNVDRLLARWEQWNAGVKTFDCRFKRWVYDTAFNKADVPKFVDLGTIKYAAPDHGLFRIDGTEKDGVECAIEDARAEHWVFDGKSLIECNYVKRQIIERRLPPDLQGTNLADGPLGFAFPAGMFSSVFGPLARPFPLDARAKEFKEHYYIRQIAPPDGQQDHICLEAYPRPSRLVSAFQKVQLICQASDMSPVAMKIVQANGKDYVAYQFFDVAVNASSTPSGDDPFHPAVPRGWQKTVETPSAER
jgi:TIGR03009 family protein